MMTVSSILDDPSASHWLKSALASALKRDAVDAASDAETLAGILRSRATVTLAECDHSKTREADSTSEPQRRRRDFDAAKT